MCRFAVLCLLVMTLLIFTVQSARSQDQGPDWILHHGKIITVDKNFSIAEAVAIPADRFTAVGSNEDVLKLAGSRTRKLDLQGRTVIPGLMDNHLHSTGGGPGVDLSRTRTLQEVLDAIAERIKQSKPGDLVVTNSDWHEAQLKEQRLPLLRDLDPISPNNPVVVRGGHEYILNSAALQSGSARWTCCSQGWAGRWCTRKADFSAQARAVYHPNRLRQHQPELPCLPAQPPGLAAEQSESLQGLPLSPRSHQKPGQSPHSQVWE